MNLPVNPIEVTLQILDNRWKVLILRELLGGKKRFNQLKKDVKGISQKVLSHKLKEMEQSGLLNRKEEQLKVEYSLTDVGYTLRPIIESFYEWGKDYKKYNKLLKKG